MVSSGSWTIDAHTLMPRIINHEEFQAEFKEDPYLEVIELMWSGNAEKAMILLKPETSFRARTLQAEALARLGDFEVSFQAYRNLVDEFSGTSREATIRQHFGKALFLAQKINDALKQFELAYKLRQAFGADASLIESSVMAIKRCQEMLGMEVHTNRM